MNSGRMKRSEKQWREGCLIYIQLNAEFQRIEETRRHSSINSGVSKNRRDKKVFFN